MSEAVDIITVAFRGECIFLWLQEKGSDPCLSAGSSPRSLTHVASESLVMLLAVFASCYFSTLQSRAYASRVVISK